MDQFEKLRPVGRLEQYSTARHQVGFYLNVAVTATYTLPATFTRPVKDYVYRACATVITQHPVLSAIPADDDTQNPYFVRLPHINLDEVVSFKPRASPYLESEETSNEPVPGFDLQALLETQHNVAFSAPSPFWRLAVLFNAQNERKFTAVYVFHHALGDGNSGQAFHRTFLRALEPISSGETRSLITSPSTPLLPSIEALHPLPLSFLYLAKKIFEAKIWSRRPRGLWAGGNIQIPLKTRIRLVPFPRAIVNSLRKCCRRERTTITALLQTVVARSLFTHIPPEYFGLDCTGALSCRRWLPNTINDESMGVFVSSYDETYTRSGVAKSDGSFPWEEARRSRQNIETVLGLQGKDSSIGLLRLVNDYQRELCLSQLGNSRDKSFEVSNIGVIECDSDSTGPRIGGMVFSQCGSVIGNALGVSVVTGGDGCLVVALSWQENVVENDLVDALVATMRKEMHCIAGQT